MRPTALRIAGFAAAVPLLLAAAACAGESPGSLVIAVQPTATPEELSLEAAEMERFLEDRLSADVQLLFPTTYAGVIEALRFGHADAAFMSAWPAALANEHAGAEVVLAEVREVIIGQDSTVAPYYYSYWVVPQGSPYQSLADLRGKKVAFPSQSSTSGYVAPVARLVELGLLSRDGGEADPGEFFDEVVFAGGYAQAWEALQAGRVDVSVIAGDVPEGFYREVVENSRVLAEQGPIPSHAVVVSRYLRDPLRSDLIDALTELGQPENRELMRKLVSGIFVRFEPTTTAEYLASLNQFLDITRLAFTEKIPVSAASASTESDSGPAPELEPVPEPDPEAGAVPRGVVRPAPAGAQQVQVGLREWAISADRTRVAAGRVYFLVSNEGETPHEFVVIRTDLGPHELPVVAGRVPEGEADFVGDVDFIGEIEPFQANSQASMVLNLVPGNYALICNLVEGEAGDPESHYQLGMAATLRVE